MAWVDKRVLKSGKSSYKVCWRDPNGRKRSKTFPPGHKKDALRFLREIERSKDTGTYFDPHKGKISLGEFFAYYWKTSRPDSPSSKELYEQQWRTHIEPRLGHLRLNAITNPVVKIFIADLREAAVGAATIVGVHKVLRRMLSVAVEDGYIAVNLAAKVKVPAPPKREPSFLEPSQVVVLAEAMDDRYKTLVHLLGCCGLRIGEAAALRIKHVNLTRGIVRIQESSKEVKGGLVTGPPKSKEPRSVGLPDFLLDMLTQHIEAFSDARDPEALVFTTVQGRQIRANGFRARILKPALGKTGLPQRVRTHDLRHSAASIAISAGDSTKQVKEMLGHHSIVVTDQYLHLLDGDRQASLDRRNAAFVTALELSQEGGTVVRLPDQGEEEREMAS